MALLLLKKKSGFTLLILLSDVPREQFCLFLLMGDVDVYFYLSSSQKIAAKNLHTGRVRASYIFKNNLIM